MHGRLSTLTVSEVFGPTIQGEGPSLGRRCGFVRLGRCNLTCSWCDTPYTWDWKGRNGTAHDPSVELSRTTIDAVATEIEAMRVPLVVVTGGEPLLQQRGLAVLARTLTGAGTEVEVETNGTLVPDPELAGLVHRFNVGLKLANSGVDAARRLVPTAIDAFLGVESIFKFVVSEPDDLTEIHDVADAHAIPAERVWVMPEGTTSQRQADAARELVGPVLAAGWNLTTRFHVLLWGDVRGR